MAQITWQNVNAPDLSKATALSMDANVNLQKAIDPFKNIISDLKSKKRRETTEDIIASNREQALSLNDLKGIRESQNFSALKNQYGRSYVDMDKIRSSRDTLQSELTKKATDSLLTNALSAGNTKQGLASILKTGAENNMPKDVMFGALNKFNQIAGGLYGMSQEEKEARQESHFNQEIALKRADMNSRAGAASRALQMQKFDLLGKFLQAKADSSINVANVEGDTDRFAEEQALNSIKETLTGYDTENFSPDHGYVAQAANFFGIPSDVSNYQDIYKLAISLGVPHAQATAIQNKMFSVHGRDGRAGLEAGKKEISKVVDMRKRKLDLDAANKIATSTKQKLQSDSSAKLYKTMLNVLGGS